ncbi:TPA: hypothetical protein ACIVGF_002854 [Salmonella enterica subsp. enterica serovar 16:l,v:-]|nr:hypothetical protein [Salmonella enterica]
MSKRILSTAEHNHALADVNAIRTMLQNYAASHPKKYGVEVALILGVPAVIICGLGYAVMTGISLGAGVFVTSALSMISYGALGLAGFLKPHWREDEISLSDLNKIRSFSSPVKKIVSKNMEQADGALTYTQLETILTRAESLLQQDKIRLNISKQLSVMTEHSKVAEHR